MIVVAAFRQGVLWGLACLFLPFAAIVFVILHWEETRPWLFLNVGGLLVATLGSVFNPAGGDLANFAQPAGWQDPVPIIIPEAQEPDRGRAPAEETRVEDDPLGAVLALPPGTGQGAVAPPPVEDAAPATPAESPQRTREEIIAPSQVGRYLNRLVEITKTDGERFKARIREEHDEILLVERPVGGGSITFNLRRSEIREIKITIAPTYAF